MCVRDRKREGECEADVEGKIVCETEKERERTFEVWWKYVKGKKKKEIIEEIIIQFIFANYFKIKLLHLKNWWNKILSII